ncbi:MAG TPA: YopX family protein [Rummeliibacillus sp.]|nr:YopX family protein [Rummeliibacillus sp.]
MKYRVWDKINKTFNPGIVLTQDGDLLTYKNPDDFILSLFSGYCDKNNKEIYEGDVIRIEAGLIGVDQEKWNNKKLFILFIDGMFCGRNPFETIILSYITNNIYLNMEIIGNIYENPELMEDK